MKEKDELTQAESIMDDQYMEVPSASVDKILSGFKLNINSISDYFHNFGEVTTNTDKDGLKNISKIVRSHFQSLGINIDAPDEEGGGHFEGILKEDPDKVNKAFAVLAESLKKTNLSIRNFDIFSRSSFLMLNNYFEYLISDLMSYFYNKYQASLNEKKLDFTLKEINEYETIAEAVKAFITKEVEALMAELSFDGLLGHFEEKLKINNEKEFIKWDLITEARERRHLIVHNSSTVNKKYLLRTKNQFKLKLLDSVEVDKEYFASACNEFYLAGLLISYNCWGRWDGDNVDECASNILDETFELLVKKEYDIVRRLSEYAIKRIEPRSEDQENYLIRINFNRLIAIKKTEKKQVLEKELKNIKVGTAAPIFKLAHAILSDKQGEVLPLIKQVKALDELEGDDYTSWPLFDFVRDIPELDELIRKELGMEPIYVQEPIQADTSAEVIEEQK